MFVHTDEHMFGRILAVGAVVLGLWAFSSHDLGATGPGRSYRVKARDTLWSIAVATYPGDPREGVWELQRRNHLDGTTIVPGQLLILP